MATKRRKSHRRSCKHGKLKQPVRTKKGGKRRCKKSRKSRKKKKRKSYKMWYTDAYEPKPSTRLEDMPAEIKQGIFSRLDNFDLDNLTRVPGNVGENAQHLLTRRPIELIDPRMPNEMVTTIFENSSLDELTNLYNTNRRLRAIAVGIVRRRIAPMLNNNLAVSELFSASSNGNTALVELLLDAGADINSRDNASFMGAGRTALMFASGSIYWEQSPDTARLLLRRGANPHLQDNHGNTALLDASTVGNIDIVRMLLNAGVNVNIRNDVGISPLRNARVYGHTDIENLLIQAGAT